MQLLRAPKRVSLHSRHSIFRLTPNIPPKFSSNFFTPALSATYSFPWNVSTKISGFTQFGRWAMPEICPPWTLLRRFLSLEL
jgi:hypothetical protein